MRRAALLHASYALAHAPDLVRYGSKPSREIVRDLSLVERMYAALRPWPEVVAYPPNQAFIGNLSPESLADRPRPWTDHPVEAADPVGPLGRIVDQTTLYGLMLACDDFDLLTLSAPIATEARTALDSLDDVLGIGKRLEKVTGVSEPALGELMEREAGLPIYHKGQVVGFLRQAHDRDDSLKAGVLLENLACKATAVLALADAFGRSPIRPEDVDYLLNTGEEAVGDRYQRGAGSLSKAVGEVAGCVNATGSDVKAFCAAPVHGLIIAAGLVQAGVFEHVVVLGGGSLAKLGMKFRGHLESGVPLMEDALASMAFIVGPENGSDPVFRLDSIGRHPIGAGSSARAIYQALVLESLARLGLGMTEVDRYAVELHNPEITLPAGSNDVPETNYRTLAALAVMEKQIKRDGLEQFAAERGMPGFAPTQGHIPAGVPYLGHARAAMKADGLNRVMVVAKGSLFLGRMTQLVDGVSIIMEKP